ncbi:hypothetical protein NQ314_006048 [Rhamnusium bicolor]|uniref:CRAL-TRIO domain-containing protein n=1 Tax=Rhamnusium bicolor TaxID=1586634 RepID=A0AAV8ZBE8_9CUCU|nr:hypothetical protein NQ314_006048 [Rhamnusium bicolor]
MKAFINMEEPPLEIVQWAKENINEDPDNRDQVVSDFKDLIFASGECTPHRTDDDFLLRFLRARHFILKKAHRLMVNYYNFKEANPQYFKNINLERIRELARDDIISVPPYKDQLGRRIMILRVGIWDPSEYKVEELIQLTVGILEASIMEQLFQIQGGIAIFDLSDLGFNHVWQLNSAIANHIVTIAMSSFPIRIEAVHILHQSWIFEIAYNFIRPLINENVKDRILFHGDDLENFHRYVDPKHLPKRYGGVHLDYPVDIWFEDCIKYDDHIIKELVELGYEGIIKLREERDHSEK